MSRLGVKWEGGVGTAGTAGEQAIWVTNIDERLDGTSKLALLIPGHGAGPSQFAPNSMGGLLAYQLALRGGWGAVAIQAVGPTAWGKQSVVDAIEAARVAGVAKGFHGPKVAIIDYSEGGVGGDNYYKQHMDKIGAKVSFSGVHDLAWADGLAGHTPVASPNYDTEIVAAYGSWAATAGYRIYDEPASFRGGPPWRLYHPTDDSVVPHDIAANHVAAVADANVALRVPDTLTGDHTGFWANIPAGEVVKFLDAGNWS